MQHINDTKVLLGTGLDRPVHLGEGMIGSQGIKKVILHPRFDKIPIILETSKKSGDVDSNNLRRISNLPGIRQTRRGGGKPGDQ